MKHDSSDSLNAFLRRNRPLPKPASRSEKIRVWQRVSGEQVEPVSSLGHKRFSFELPVAFAGAALIAITSWSALHHQTAPTASPLARVSQSAAEAESDTHLAVSHSIYFDFSDSEETYEIGELASLADY